MASKYKDIVAKAWDCNEVDWDEYESHRPPYTRELYHLIFQHHGTHGNGQYRAALDVGAGGGTVTRVLLEEFDHVTFSDPSAEYIARAQCRFHSETDAARISFLQRRFDEFIPEKDFPNGGVDMITAGTCIHFGSAEKLTSQLALLLRPGGTFAAFSYGSVPILPPDDPAGPVVKECKDKIMRWIHENVAPVDKAEGTGTGQARYANVAFDPALWRDVRRVTSLVDEPVWPEWIAAAESRVREGEREEVVGHDFICKEVGFAFFPLYFANLAPPLPILEQIGNELQELEGLMGERRVRVKWPVVMVLSTKA